MEQNIMEQRQAYLLLKESIKLLADIPDELSKRLFDICLFKRIDKRQHFVRSGESPEYVGFNLNGIFRFYYIDQNGNDWTKGFLTQGNFVISYTSLILNRPSSINIEAITNSDVLQFKYKEWEKLIELDLRWYPFLYKIMQKVYIMKELREKSFLLDDATQRYLEFRKEFPEVEEKAKLYEIASFIGVTPESLSRIRNKLKLT